VGGLSFFGELFFNVRLVRTLRGAKSIASSDLQCQDATHEATCRLLVTTLQMQSPMFNAKVFRSEIARCY
jgi:hypothetical protein